MAGIGLRVDATGAAIISGTAGAGSLSPGPLPTNNARTGAVTPQNATATTAAGAAITATLPAAAGLFTYLTSIIISLGTGTAGVVTATITGVQGGPLNIVIATPAAEVNTYQYTFPVPLVSTAVNTAIAVAVPATGGAAAVNAVTATGYQG